VPVACGIAWCSPWAAVFPFQPPPELALLGSAGSAVLHCGPTPPLRTCPPCGFAPSRPALPYRQGQRRSPGSRACCFLACPGSQTTADSSCPRAYGQADVAFPVSYQVGFSIFLFEAQYPGHQCPCLRFDSHLTVTAAKLGVRMVRYSFPIGLFHPLQHAGLSRRTTD